MHRCIFESFKLRIWELYLDPSLADAEIKKQKAKWRFNEVNFFNQLKNRLKSDFRSKLCSVTKSRYSCVLEIRIIQTGKCMLTHRITPHVYRYVKKLDLKKNSSNWWIFCQELRDWRLLDYISRPIQVEAKD